VLGFRGAFSRFFAESGLFLAAGLAFFFLVCVIPLSLLGVATIGFVLSAERAEQEVVGQLVRNFPVYRREIEAVMIRIVDTRAISGITGTLVLIFFSMPLFGASRLVLHRMLGVRAGGGYVRNMVADAGLVLLLTVLLFAASSVTWIFQWFQEIVTQAFAIRGQVVYATSLGFSLTLSTGMFFLAYRFIPRRRPRVGSALAGAVVVSLLWEVAKQLFRLYIREIGVYDQIYGAFGVLVAFVMFVYYSAIVFVFGAALVAALDARQR
jgi:membrane protein